MNIFEALQYGKGSINEENISSFLGYLLNPKGDHTLGDVFFKRFVSFIGLKPAEIDMINLNKIEINFEYSVCNDNVDKKQKRYIDILFETTEHIIAIENKVVESSCSKINTQIKEEYNGLLGQKDKSIIFCVLTPKKIKKIESPKIENNDKFLHIYWEDVINLLKNILKDDLYGDINPIDSYTKQTIKAFINFMNTARDKFKIFSINGKKYRIFKFRDNSISLEQAISDEWFVVSKGNKKDVIKEALLQKKIMPLEELDNLTKGNTTYELGRLLYNKLK